MKKIKVEWCENWIRSRFARLPVKNGGIEAGYFWKLAEESGLWVRGTYGSPMSEALAKLTKIETVTHDGAFCYNVFRLA